MRIAKIFGASVKSQVIFVFASVLALAACSSSANDAARQPTQTPWIIYVPVTVTPEPAIFTPLPTSELKTAATATRLPTTRPAATRASTSAPVVAAPTATSAPACNLGTVDLTEPKDGTTLHTKRNQPGGDTIVFKWTPPASIGLGSTDSKIGYLVDIESRRQNTHVNGARKMLSHNKSIENANVIYGNDKRFILDKVAVKSLTGGDDVTVSMSVTVVKAINSFNDQTFDEVPVVLCGAPSARRVLQLIVED